MPENKPAFQHRSYYVNFASHLLNSWNVNLLFPDAPGRWSAEQFARFLDMVKTFGFTCFEFWLVPTLFSPEALKNEGRYRQFAETMQLVIGLAHERGLEVKFINGPNCIGHDWYFACPNDNEDMELIEKLWRHWMRSLRGVDIVGLFPGDPGGCNRNGCDHNTLLDLYLKLTEITSQENPAARMEIGTWGTPFSGWGDDLAKVPNWDGSWKMLLEGIDASTGIGCHIWNGGPKRARQAMNDFIRRLSEFPEDATVAINLGFSPDADATVGGDAREYIRQITKQRPVNSWDYSVAEGELVAYPHWRLPRILSRRQEEHTLQYDGCMTYTMSPMLSQLSMFAAGQAGMDPALSPDVISREFCRRVFGSEHEKLGELFEAFEVVPAWGHYPRRHWSAEVAHNAYLQIIEHLEAADVNYCDLPLFPSAQQYQQDVLWFARMFARLSEPGVDRKTIEREYWQRSLNIYDHIPMSTDARAEEAARQFSHIFGTPNNPV